MPIDYRKTVLLGDSDSERAELLIDVIRNDFRTNVLRVEYFEDVDSKVREAAKADQTWKLILLAAELKESPTVHQSILPRHFYYVSQHTHRTVGCVYTSAEPPEDDAVGVHVPAFKSPSPGVPDRRQQLINQIVTLRLGGLKLWEKPLVDLDDDLVLHEQVRDLSPTRNIEKAKDTLAYLIRDFQGGQSEAVTVSRLIQGASGSKVFRFRPTAASETNERVLKVLHYSQEWKLNEEVPKHLQAQQSLNSRYEGYVPDIEVIAGGDNQHIASYYDWRAIAYDFVGGESFKKRGNQFGKFMDLETALIGSYEELRERTSGTPFEEHFATKEACASGRRHFLEVLLDWLSDNWYIGRAERKDREVLWDYSDGPDNNFGRFPPYQIPRRSKRYILNFLDEQQSRLGERFFDDWKTSHGIVHSFVAGSDKELKETYNLATSQRVILSPAHGDLNSNNILMWLDSSHPFLIDFPLFQGAGHALQDFARLEVEVKFTLMDRQQDSTASELPALDLTYSQLPLWHALEKQILKERWNVVNLKLPAGGFHTNVQYAFELVKLIRLKAMAVQNQHQQKRCPGFWTEYKLPLLYSTLRAIGYDSLSPFKRLIAISSAAELLKQCQAKSTASFRYRTPAFS